MKVTANRKSEQVTAYQFDGGNARQIETALAEHTGRIIKPILDPQKDRGVWIVLQPLGRWQTLPDRAFHRVYAIERPRSCFECVHFVTLVGTGRCTVFDEPVDSEIIAARDCDEYELEG